MRLISVLTLSLVSGSDGIRVPSHKLTHRKIPGRLIRAAQEEVPDYRLNAENDYDNQLDPDTILSSDQNQDSSYANDAENIKLPEYHHIANHVNPNINHHGNYMYTIDSHDMNDNAVELDGSDGNDINNNHIIESESETRADILAEHPEYKSSLPTNVNDILTSDPLVDFSELSPENSKSGIDDLENKFVSDESLVGGWIPS